MSDDVRASVSDVFGSCTFRSLVFIHRVLPEAILMQKKRASALQQAWGDKPCDHPAFAKEYDNGERTGNYVCTQCGTTVTFRQKAELTAGRRGDGSSE